MICLRIQPNPTNLYASFSFDVSSRRVLKSSKLLSPEMIRNPTDLNGSSRLTRCPKNYLQIFKIVRPQNDAKPDRCVWSVLIWCVVQNNSYSCSKQFAPDMVPKPTSLYVPFSLDVLSKHVPKDSKYWSQNVSHTRPTYMPLLI